MIESVFKRDCLAQFEFISLAGEHRPKHMITEDRSGEHFALQMHLYLSKETIHGFGPLLVVREQVE